VSFLIYGPCVGPSVFLGWHFVCVYSKYMPCPSMHLSLPPLLERYKNCTYSTNECLRIKGGQKNLFYFFRRSQIDKFFGLFRYRKSANFLVVPVRKLQTRKFCMINPQIENPHISEVSQSVNYKSDNFSVSYVHMGGSC
jgi:hypothetical protein